MENVCPDVSSDSQIDTLVPSTVTLDEMWSPAETGRSTRTGAFGTADRMVTAPAGAGPASTARPESASFGEIIAGLSDLREATQSGTRVLTEQLTADGLMHEAATGRLRFRGGILPGAMPPTTLTDSHGHRRALVPPDAITGAPETAVTVLRERGEVAEQRADDAVTRAERTLGQLVVVQAKLAEAEDRAGDAERDARAAWDHARAALDAAEALRPPRSTAPEQWRCGRERIPCRDASHTGGMWRSAQAICSPECATTDVAVRPNLWNSSPPYLARPGHCAGSC